MGQVIVGRQGGVPAGTVLAFAGTNAPPGYLICDGSSLLRDDYPRLFAVIGTTWGAADSDHFNLPDMRRRTVVGAGGTGTSVLGSSVGDTGGAETHTLVVDEMPRHRHTITPRPWVATGPVGGTGKTGVIDWGTEPVTRYEGGDEPHNNMQPSAVMNHIIKT